MALRDVQDNFSLVPCQPDCSSLHLSQNMLQWRLVVTDGCYPYFCLSLPQRDVALKHFYVLPTRAWEVLDCL
jgi:hypothetical protein